MEEDPDKRNIKRWLEKSLIFEEIDFEELREHVIDSIEKHRFNFRQNKEFKDSIHLEAVYGSKLKAFLIGIIPFGKHFPSGKRLFIKASILNESTDI